MPIPIEHLDKNLEQTEQQVLSFLTEHPELAYEAYEVAQGLAAARNDVIPEGWISSVGRALDKLADSHLVDIRIRGEINYYSIH